MASTTDTNFYNNYSSMLMLLVQQRAAKLRPVVDVEMATGEKHFFNRLGKVAADEVLVQFQDLVIEDAPHSRRMATLRKYVKTLGIDEFDLNRMNLDPAGAYAQTLAAALGRKFDEVVVAAALGTAATGKDGAGTQAFDSNMSIAAGGTGFTVLKFHQALAKLQANDVDISSEPVFLLLPATGIEDLMAESAFTSADYQDIRPLAGTRLPSFRGVQIIHTQTLALKGVMMTQGAVKVAMAADISTKVKDQVSKVDTNTITSTMVCGAVRMEEERIVEINYA